MPALVIAYHLVITAYGFWLPNDPRGSWSDFLRSWELLRFGKATKTNERRSLARKPHDRAKRLAAKRSLVREAVQFTGVQARAIANGFADYCERSGLVVHACAILPTHAHLVTARHHISIEQVSRLLKGAASTSLINQNLHPFQDVHYADRRCPSPWSRGQWSVFLDTPADILRAIRYVQNNPTREGFPNQHWRFITPYVA